ncbi:AhpC/TSA family protein [Abditibacterium utsteinense]|uniref:AhpC/TSA family protein n=1 Tax=Abditibacterium utsteinense TaxID=1960156 RepID=A0A2S8SXF9_9BACT|nr:redoxin domain-containing protein [Abditibacterium utsteinense]PQV65487.1 AhpC/TSA family protein [Abditibacterium utsteinense]
MKISSRQLALFGLVAAVSLPVWAHNLDKKSFGQLKSEQKNFAHAKSAVVKMNAPMPGFAAPTIDGKGLSKASFKGKMGLFVLADTQCPCVKAVESRISNLSKKYGAKGLRVAYVFSTPGEKPLAIARYMQNHQIPFPAIVDRDQRILKMLDGQCSSEVYLTDKAGILRYHGRVDDSTFDPKAVISRDLENAVVALTQNKRVTKNEVPAMGCAIPRI